MTFALASCAKNGSKLKLAGQPFQVLAILLERPGELVTREELQKRPWPDTFVDVEHNLNTAINKIREALGDSAENPRLVETLSRRGYRFMAPIAATATSQKEEAAPEHRSGPRTLVNWTVPVGFFTLAILLVYQWPRPHSQELPATLVPLPFTSLPGIETAPAFSPEGSRIAFAWNGDADSSGTPGFDLYVKAIGSETLLRLTHHPSEWMSPVWSPDGTQIAFHGLAGTDTGIYVVPASVAPNKSFIPHV